MSQMPPLEMRPSGLISLAEFVHKAENFKLFQEPLKEGVDLFVGVNEDLSESSELDHRTRLIKLAKVGNLLEDQVNYRMQNSALEQVDGKMVRILEARVMRMFEYVSRGGSPGSRHEQLERMMDFEKDILSEREHFILKMISRGVLQNKGNRFSFPAHITNNIEGAFIIKGKEHAKPQDKSVVRDDFWKVLLLFPFETYQ